MNSTSASATRSERLSLGAAAWEPWRVKSVIRVMRVLLLCFLMLVVLCAPLRAEVLDRVVASVDDIALTLSELEANYRSMKDRHPNITHEEVINSMINRVLLLRAAEKMILEALTDDALLKEYVEIKIRSLVVIKEETVMQYYSENPWMRCTTISICLE